MVIYKFGFLNHNKIFMKIIKFDYFYENNYSDYNYSVHNNLF